MLVWGLGWKWGIDVEDDGAEEKKRLEEMDVALDLFVSAIRDRCNISFFFFFFFVWQSFGLFFFLERELVLWVYVSSLQLFIFALQACLCMCLLSREDKQKFRESVFYA